MRSPKLLRTLIILTAFGLLLGMAASASAITTPLPGIYVDGVYQDSVINTGTAQAPIYSYNNGTLTVGASGAFDPDPGIGWSVNATNATALPVDVTVIFGLFPTPGYPGPILLNSFSTIGITDGTGPLGGNSDAFVSVQPFQNPTLPNNLGLIAVNYTGFISGSDVVVTNSWGTNPGFAGGVPKGTGYANIYFFDGVGLGGPNDVFFEIVSFELSANDQVAFTGNCSFAVPIPPTALLMGSGLLGLGLVGWRRRRQS